MKETHQIIREVWIEDIARLSANQPMMKLYSRRAVWEQKFPQFTQLSRVYDQMPERSVLLADAAAIIAELKGTDLKWKIVFLLRYKRPLRRWKCDSLIIEGHGASIDPHSAQGKDVDHGKKR